MSPTERHVQGVLCLDPNTAESRHSSSAKDGGPKANPASSNSSNGNHVSKEAGLAWTEEGLRQKVADLEAQLHAARNIPWHLADATDGSTSAAHDSEIPWHLARDMDGSASVTV